MPSTRTYIRSFAGGEMTPGMQGRIDLAKQQTGLLVCRNFIPKAHGEALNRTGTEFVLEVKNSAVATRVIEFSYSNAQTFCIELGAGYFRWHTAGGTVSPGTPSAWSNVTAYNVGDMCLQGGVVYYCILGNTNNVPPNATYWYAMPANIYEIPNSYAAGDLFSIKYVQEADVVTLTHQNYPPAELRRYANTKWVFANINFVAAIAAPSSCTATNSGAGGTLYQYVVTALNAGSIDESVASSIGSCSNDLTISGHNNFVTWPVVTGAVRYNIYKWTGGIFGYCGQSTSNGFYDYNVTPDGSRTPPNYDTVFSGSGNYPGAVAYYQQRRIFAGTQTQPQNVWATVTGTESNMSYSIPTKDTDRLAFKVNAQKASTIRHMIPMKDLMLMSDSVDYALSPINGVLTPSTVSVSPESNVGANDVVPIVVGKTLLFVSAIVNHVMEMVYNWQYAGYKPADISILAPHLFDYYQLSDMAYQKASNPVIWVVRNDGTLLGLTYVPDEQVSAWHRHDTVNGAFESVCNVSESTTSENMLYFVVRRTINGVTKRYIERLHTRNFATQADSWFVDAGIEYNGSPATVIGGISHLEGQTVNVLADGGVHPQCVVTGGQITLNYSASKVIVGLPITADLQPMPPAIEGDPAMGQGRMKNISRAWIRILATGGIQVGPNFVNMRHFVLRTNETYGTPTALGSNEYNVAVDPSWVTSGTLCLRQTDPLPADIVNMTLEVSVGG